MHAARQVALLEGIFAEPTGAVSLAALSQLKNSPDFSPQDCVVCVVTGHGLKQVRSFESEMKMPSPIDPSLPSLAAFLEYPLKGRLGEGR
jgi:threonine synthase